MAIHFIEHIPVWQAEVLIAECYEALAVGGKLILEQPDISYAARVLIGEVEPPSGGAPGQFDMWPLYGDPTHKNELMLHRWGYTPLTLTEMVVRCGFNPAQVTILPAQYHQPVRDFRLEAVK